ncbi:MAG: alpha-L-rhamnosidase [Phycisphaerae bacterium]|nr:alpha-L-rhamnosidase [Phycisphaerae bacterium]
MLFQNTQQKLIREYSEPIRQIKLDDHEFFFDFGNAMFGTVVLTLRAETDAAAAVGLGEKLAGENRIDREPPGCIRYARADVPVTAGTKDYRVALPEDQRNTTPPAVPLPEEFGVVLPFRYCELTLPEGVKLQSIRREAILYPFNDDAADFECDNDDLNAVWELCKHTIKATTFLGIYVDGDRERIAYEGDAYINQLSHYCLDSEYDLARATQEHLLFSPTWFTEWALHNHLIAWADYWYTGSTALLEAYYDELKKRTLSNLADENGLISTETGLVTEEFLRELRLTRPIKDIVDWPHAGFTENGVGERDGYEMTPFNTVVNAFYYNSLRIMSDIAAVLGKPAEAGDFRKRAGYVREQFQRAFFDASRGIYIDGIDSSHASLHANMFPLAFGLAERQHHESILKFIRSRGMACSVYGAQYLLEALYNTGQSDYAFELMTAGHDRGWLNMIRRGSTMTMEAWDLKYKKNLDWNHAWGTAPANIIIRYLVGCRPAAPGCRKMILAPQPSKYLHRFRAKVPTPHGTIEVQWKRGEELQYNAPAEIEMMVNTSTA